MAGCISCGTCSPWWCQTCGEEICNWFEAEKGCCKRCGEGRNEGLHRISLPPEGGEVVASKEGIILEAPPIFAWAVGRSIREFGLRAMKKGGYVTKIRQQKET